VRVGCVVGVVAQEAPAVVSTSATSTSVHVRWTSPFFVGAPLIGYRLSVHAAALDYQRPTGSTPPGADDGSGGGSRQMERVKEVLVSNTAQPELVMSEVFII